MSKITDYKVIGESGNRKLAAEVKRFIDKGEGWEPHGAPLAVTNTDGETCAFNQAIVKREPEHEELERLRQMERLIEQLDEEMQSIQGKLSSKALGAYIREMFAKVLRGGPYERKDE